MRKDDHVGCTFALLGEFDRVRCHSGFHPAIRLPGQPTSVINRRKLTLNGELRNCERLHNLFNYFRIIDKCNFIFVLFVPFCGHIKI